MFRIGEKYVADILLFLLEEEETTMTGFKEISTYYKSVVNKAEDLEDMGLVKIDRQTKPFVKMSFELTEKGKKIAKQLKKVEENMKELEG